MAKIHLTNTISRFTGWINSEWPYSLQRDGRGGLYTHRTQPYLGGKDRSHWDLLIDLARMSGDTTDF